MKKKTYHPFAALAVLAATTAAATAATGSLHSAFGAAGKATANYGGTDSANAVAVMPNGKVVVAGTTNALGNSDVAVLRYHANGTLDTSFDNDGGVITDLGSATTDTAKAVAVQPDGKILVAGGNGTNSVVVRYNPDGSLDTFFGVGGKLAVNASGTDEATCLVLQSGGKILVGGTAWIGASPDFYVTRLNSDGTADTSFNSGSIQVEAFGSNDVCTSMAVQADGKVVLAGYSDFPGTNDFAVIRFTAAGLVDTTFDGDGQVTTSFGHDDRANSVAIQPDGKIVAGGFWSGGSSDFALVRYNTNGTLDNTFSGDGKANAAFSPSGFGLQEFGTSMVLQPDGRIVIAGYTNQFDASNDFGIMRFSTDGTLDTTFDGDGKVTTAFGTGTADFANAMVRQPDGRILVVGSSADNFAAARYNMLTRTDARIGANKKANSGNNVYNTTGAGQTLNATIAKSGGKKNSFVRIQNDGHDNEVFNVTGSGNTSTFTIRYFNGAVDITPNVIGAGFNTASLAPGASQLIKVVVTAKTKKPNKNASFSITGKAASDATNTDTVVIKAKSK